MGAKYQIRTNEIREFGDTTDYYVNSLFGLLKLLITKRKQLIFVKKHYFNGEE